MSVYGIGCYYSGEDEFVDFISRNIACMGHDPKTHQYFTGLFDDIIDGDIIFIKSFIRRKGIVRVKAIGIARKPNAGDRGDFGYGINVDWINSNPDGIIDINTESDGGWQPRSSAIFREYNKRIINQIQNLAQRSH